MHESRTLTVVVLAAGAARRYGGGKQQAAVGPTGEFLLEFSLFDAIKAGFERVVLVVQEPDREVFEKQLSGKLPPGVALEFCYQDLRDLPMGFEVTARTKPWGTGHAVWSARRHVEGPFAVVNADDFYGVDIFPRLAEELRSQAGRPTESSPASTASPGSVPGVVVSMPVAETLSPSGGVNRALCKVSRSGQLEGLHEITNVRRMREPSGSQAASAWESATGSILFDDPADGEPSALDDSALVSMNMWGLQPSIFALLEERFREFLRSTGDRETKEFFLPDAIGSMITERLASIGVIRSDGPWCGMTYKDDRRATAEVLARLTEKGHYPAPLWQPSRSSAH